jgi:hypothetical protein
MGHAAELSQMIEQHLRTEPSGGRSLRELVQAAVDRLGYTSSSR